MKRPFCFDVMTNEGAFFHEYWLIEYTWGSPQHYRYDRIPRDVLRRFATFIREKKNITPSEAEILLTAVQIGRYADV